MTKHHEDAPLTDANDVGKTTADLYSLAAPVTQHNTGHMIGMQDAP